MVLELRPAHDPRKAYGFVGVVASTADLSASVWLWERDGDGTFKAEKVITIPPEPAETEQLPPALQPFGAVPPLITDIALSVDDQSLVVSCWGTGELKRYDVSDPRNPRETGSVRLGGIVERAAHPAAGAAQRRPADGRAVSRDGKRVYLTNSLYASWDAQFYPDGIDGWLVKLDAGEDGSLTLDPDLFVEFSGRAAAPGAPGRRRRVVATRTASPTESMHDALALDPARAAGRLSRAEPRDGLAVRGRARACRRAIAARCCGRCRRSRSGTRRRSW